jgi:hypothetical protein
MYPFGAETPVVVEPPQHWPALLPPEQTPAVYATVATAYLVGLLGGALWGGWKGLLAGALGASALTNGIGTAVYANQPDRATYSKLALVAGGISLLEAGLAVWLSRKVVDQREDEGRSVFGLAH